MIPRPSISRDSGQLDPRCSTTDIPLPQSATLGLHPVARKLLLISRPAEGRRLSWPEHTVGEQLAQGCLQEPRARFTLATWNLRMWYSPTRPPAPTEAHGCEQLAQSCYPAVRRPGVEPAISRSRVQRPTTTLLSHLGVMQCLYKHDSTRKRTDCNELISTVNYMSCIDRWKLYRDKNRSW